MRISDTPNYWVTYMFGSTFENEVHAPSHTIFEFQNKNHAIILYIFRTIELEFCTPSTASVFTIKIWGLEAHGSCHLRISGPGGRQVLRHNFGHILFNFVQSSSNFIHPSLLWYSPPKTARTSKKHTQTAGEMVSGTYSPRCVPYHFPVVVYLIIFQSFSLPIGLFVLICAATGWRYNNLNLLWWREKDMTSERSIELLILPWKSVLSFFVWYTG